MISANKSAVRVDAIKLKSTAVIPNNAQLPVLLYRGACDMDCLDLALSFEELFASNQWSNGWRNGVHPYTHWHCTAHEVLGVYSGTADVQLGGEIGPTVKIEKGDVVVMPAGVAHKRLDETPGLGVVGAYADGQLPDLCIGKEAMATALLRVEAVPLPKLDPMFATDGFTHTYWNKA